MILMLSLTHLLDDAKCYETIRTLRWPDGTVRCPHCATEKVIKRGKDNTQVERQRYACKACERQFDDLTQTVFAAHHQPLRVWMGCLYLMGLNLSNRQITAELDLHKDDVHAMTLQLRQAIVERKREVQLAGEVECDEVYVTAGHKGHPAAVQKKGKKGGDVKPKGFGDAARSQPKSHPSWA